MRFANPKSLCGYAMLLAIALWTLLPARAAEPGDAAEAGPALTLNTSLSTDSSHNRNYELGGTLAVSDSTRYNFLYEYTYSPSNQTGLITHTYNLGVDQDISPAFGFGANVQHQNSSGALTSDELDGSLYWQNDDWQVTALPSFRHITLTAQGGKVTGLPPGASASLSDTPLGLRVDFGGLSNWRFEASTTRHDYSRNPVILRALSSLPFFSGSALTLSQGVIAHSSSARIERDFATGFLAFDYSVDRSALGAVYSYTSDLDYSLPLSSRFDLEITAGRTHSTNLPASKFITLNFTYYQ